MIKVTKKVIFVTLHISNRHMQNFIARFSKLNRIYEKSFSCCVTAHEQGMTFLLEIYQPYPKKIRSQ